MQVDALLVSSVRVEVNVEGSQEHRSAVGGRQLGVVMTFEEMELKLNLLKNWFISFSNITSPTDSFLTFLLEASDFSQASPPIPDPISL